MSRWLSRLTLNQKLGLVALVLGALAVFANVTPARTVTLNEQDLLTALARQEDNVTPGELAAWIIEGRADYRLLDLRDETAFAAYHIPTAENVPLAALPRAPLLRNERIVLYSDGGIHAAQAWMLLRGQGYRGVATLRGGLDAWKNEVLFPVSPTDPTPEEQQSFARAVEVSKFFGGHPRAAAAGGEAVAAVPDLTPAAPAVVAPTLPSGAAAHTKKKRREGC